MRSGLFTFMPFISTMGRTTESNPQFFPMTAARAA